MFSKNPDTITFGENDAEKKTFSVGAVAKAPLDIYYYHTECIWDIYYPISLLKTMNLDVGEGYGVTVMFTSDNAAGLESYILRNGRQDDFEFSIDNVYETNKNERDMATVITVFAYGFITLIALIAVANIFNTVSTGIILRRKEFAMLKSVGMTDRGVVKILSLESIISGIKSLVIGLPISAVMCVLIHLAISRGFETAFVVPWASIIGAVAGVFTVMFISMLYAANRLKKENILDSIRDENI